MWWIRIGQLLCLGHLTLLLCVCGEDSSEVDRQVYLVKKRDILTSWSGWRASGEDSSEEDRQVYLTSWSGWRESGRQPPLTSPAPHGNARSEETEIRSTSEESGVIEAVRVDSCILQPETDLVGESFRAVTPTKAGGEGLFLRHTDASVTLTYDNNLTLKSYDDPNQRVSYGMKFYADVPQQTYFHDFLRFADFDIVLLEDGNIGIQYQVLNSRGLEMPKVHETGIAMPSECINPENNNSNADDDDEAGWVELIGIKVKVNPREKRSMNDTTCWRLIGVEFTNDRTIAHLAIYINGKKIIRKSFSRNKEDIPQMNGHPYNSITVMKGTYSCIEVTQGDQPDNYYKDFNLNECQSEYNGESEQKFIECDNKFNNPTTPAPETEVRNLKKENEENKETGEGEQPEVSDPMQIIK